MVARWFMLRGLWKSVRVSKSGRAVLVVGAEEWNREMKFWVPAKGFRSWAKPFDYREEVELAEWVFKLKPELKELIKR